MTPPGTRAVVYEPTHHGTLWGSWGLDGWYCGPSFNNYQNMIFYIPETKSCRRSGSFELYPQHVLLPTLNEQKHTQAVKEEFLESLQTLKAKQKQKLIKS